MFLVFQFVIFTLFISFLFYIFQFPKLLFIFSPNYLQNFYFQFMKYTKLNIQNIYADSNLPNYNKLAAYMKSQINIDKKLVLKIIYHFLEILQPNLITINDPVTVVGDIHGQFYDLLKIIQLSGNPYNTKYLFLGDYVDRGMFSIQTLLYLACVKINYPSTFYMLRGNHQSRQMTSHFNFRTQCLSKFDQQVYNASMQLCDALPLAAIINNKFFAVHGGLSPHMNNITQDLSKINRFRQPSRNGIFCDLLWSDPIPEGKQRSQILPNTIRGCSFYFGPALTKKFLDKNKLSCIIRGHEVQHKGYKLHNHDRTKDFPAIVTLFSAPNYCDKYGNQGAVMKITNNTSKFIQYTATLHPYVLPNFLNLFQWSLPSISEKVGQLFLALTKRNKQQIQQDIDLSFEMLNASNQVIMLQNILKIIKNQNDRKLIQEKNRLDLVMKVLQYNQFVKVKENDKLEYSRPQFEFDFGPRLVFSKLSLVSLQYQQQNQCSFDI